MNLSQLYFSDMIAELKLILSRAFEASKIALILFSMSSSLPTLIFKLAKKSLAYLTLVEFEAWLKSKTEGRSIQEVKSSGYWPSDNQKDLALEVVVSSTFLLFEQ
ncbi:hypothetical protein OS493_026372 [Desmophyllum pertusum]|uniref:Uncharacterized protein n=1 Tax=Desmophyllum pertusum TaxID=174260 RepID=A0A9X0CW71_9CNID|nr:hypothetical protein OS493_026372 [Desmophyllum pertusum]